MEVMKINFQVIMFKMTSSARSSILLVWINQTITYGRDTCEKSQRVTGGRWESEMGENSVTSFWNSP